MNFYKQFLNKYVVVETVKVTKNRSAFYGKLISVQGDFLELQYENPKPTLFLNTDYLISIAEYIPEMD